MLILCVGLLAQVCFSVRILIQWFLSEKKHEVISPTLFWVFSLVGSYLMFYYGWLRNDFSIIVGQFIWFYIYIGNLRLKGVWRRIPLLFRILLAVTPLLAAVGTLQDSTHFVENFLKNEDIPVWLLGLALRDSLFLLSVSSISGFTPAANRYRHCRLLSG